MIARICILAVVTTVLFSAVSAQEADSTYADTLVDSLPPVLLDSVDISSPPGDSLTDTSAVGLSFDERYERYRQEHPERIPALSYFDSLAQYFASPRLNLRAQRDRSIYHDAGDYFRFDPSYFTLDHQITPMRKTVQPFGLSGDRLNLVINRMSVHPFDHVVEPDGLVDLNDMPTAFDHDLYVMAGPVGRLFGGRQVIAGLITLPRRPNGNEPSTAIIADKGDVSYSWVRGRYSRRFQSGKQIDASIGYRESEGPFLGREDDGYHYVGDFYFPIGARHGLRAAGQLYSRDGRLAVRPALGGATISRDRFDRYAELSLDRNSDDGKVHYELGYRHERQGSFSDGAYTSRYNHTAHGAFVKREWIMGRTILRVRIDGEYVEYKSYDDLSSRAQADATLEMARLVDGVRYALAVGGRYDDEFSFMPDAAAVVWKESSKMLMQLSVGYCERAPSLHELFLPFQQAPIYSSDIRDYANEGNRQLEPEKQLTGSLLFEWGSLDNAVRLNVTGGRITDGIDWQHQMVEDSVADYLLFSPINGDIDFVNVTLLQRFKLMEFVRFSGGGAYHFIEYDRYDDKAYTPEYQAFSGLELHYYWESKLLDLFAYGEVVYVGPYHGLVEDGLGEQLIANAKLSLGLKNFRFHLVFQNVLNQVYRQRDYLTHNGSFFYYGLVWNFDD